MNRKKTIVIVLDEAEKQSIQDYARADHMEVSPWCRMVIQRAIDRIEEEREARRRRLARIEDNRDINPYLMTDAELKEDEQKRRRWRD